MKDLKGNFEIFEYIKRKLHNKEISQFENYSKIYPSIIELDSNKNFEDNVFDRVNNIIKDVTFNIFQDEEYFFIIIIMKKNENITMEELIHLKNQIHIKNEENNENDIIKSKYKIFQFFKNTISNIEVINSYMTVLRAKGTSLPIKICIKISI